MTSQANNCLMGCSRSPDGAAVETDLEIDSIGPTGLVCGHAYSIVKLVELHDAKMENPEKDSQIDPHPQPLGRERMDWTLVGRGK